MVAALKDSMLDKRTAMHDRVVKCTSLGKKWAVASRLPQYYSCPASLRSISHNFLLQELGVPKSCLRRRLRRCNRRRDRRYGLREVSGAHETDKDFRRCSV